MCKVVRIKNGRKNVPWILISFSKNNFKQYGLRFYLNVLKKKRTQSLEIDKQTENIRTFVYNTSQNRMNENILKNTSYPQFSKSQL